MKVTTVLAVVCCIVVAAIVGTHLYRTNSDPVGTVWTYMGTDEDESTVVVNGATTSAERAVAAQRWHTIRSLKTSDQPRQSRTPKSRRRASARPTRLSTRGSGSSSGDVQDRTYGRALQARRSKSVFEQSRRYKMFGSHTHPNRNRRNVNRGNSRRRYNR